MSTPEHFTPGTWEWRSFGGPLLLISTAPGKPVVVQAVRRGMQGAELLMRDTRLVMRPMTADHPDAKLIAAAPDLLAACLLYIAHEDREDLSDYLAQANAVSTAIRAAVANALGRTRQLDANGEAR